MPRAPAQTSTAKRLAGVDLGGTKIETLVSDARHKVLGSARRPTPTAGGPPEVVDAIALAVREACTAARVAPTALQAIGVGSPGLADPVSGTISSARNLPDWEGSYPLGPTLSKELGPPVFVGNDVTVATNAEFELGAGEPYLSLIGVFWGTGVGGGLILDGKPWLGRGGAGEIGHTVVKLGGRRCGCGRRGCLEAYAGRASMEERARKEVKNGAKTDLFKLMKEHERTRLTSGIWARALERNDKLATQLIEEAVQALGAGIASAINLLDLEAVVIGGGLGVRLGQPFAVRIADAMHPHLFNDTRPPAVQVAALGDLGGAMGAALLARDGLAAQAEPASDRAA
jgi:glucokinase